MSNIVSYFSLELPCRESGESLHSFRAIIRGIYVILFPLPLSALFE